MHTVYFTTPTDWVKFKLESLSPFKTMITVTAQTHPRSVYNFKVGGARDVMVIVVGNGHGDTSSNPRRD